MYTEENKQEDLRFIKSTEENSQLDQAEKAFQEAQAEAQQLGQRINELERCAGNLAEAQASADPLAMQAYTQWSTLKSQLLGEQRRIRNDANDALKAAKSANDQRQLMARKARQRIEAFDEAQGKKAETWHGRDCSKISLQLISVDNKPACLVYRQPSAPALAVRDFCPFIPNSHLYYHR